MRKSPLASIHNSCAAWASVTMSFAKIGTKHISLDSKIDRNHVTQPAMHAIQAVFRTIPSRKCFYMCAESFFLEYGVFARHTDTQKGESRTCKALPRSSDNSYPLSQGQDFPGFQSSTSRPAGTAPSPAGTSSSTCSISSLPAGRACATGSCA